MNDADLLALCRPLVRVLSGPCHSYHEDEDRAWIYRRRIDLIRQDPGGWSTGWNEANVQARAEWLALRLRQRLREAADEADAVARLVGEGCPNTMEE